MQTRQHIDGTPGLKSIPILGALFRSRDYLQNQTELVVIVTPYVVDPVTEKQLNTPMDRPECRDRQPDDTAWAAQQNVRRAGQLSERRLSRPGWLHRRVELWRVRCGIRL